MKTSSAGMLIAPVAVNSYVISDISFASAAEGFDGEHIAFFHALSGSGFDEGDLFAAMDLVAQDVMASDVPNRFDRDDLSVELDFVALHYFLDCLTDVIHPGIDASFLGAFISFADGMQGRFADLEPSIGGCLDSREQIIVGRIETHGEGAIDNPTADMNSEIHFEEIVVLEDNLLGSRIGSPVSSYVVQAEPSRKSHAGLESVSRLKTLVVGQSPNAILNLLGKLTHGNAGLRDRLHILAYLAMDFGSFAIVIQELIIHAVHNGKVTNFFSCGAPKIFIVGDIFDNLALRISLIVEEIGERNARRSRLLSTQCLPFLLLFTLSFLLLAFWG